MKMLVYLQGTRVDLCGGYRKNVTEGPLSIYDANLVIEVNTY